MKNIEKAYQDSLARGETSQTLSEFAKRRATEIAAEKVAAKKVAAEKVAAQESKPEGRSGEWQDSKRQRWRDTSWSSGGGRWHDHKRRR